MGVCVFFYLRSNRNLCHAIRVNFIAQHPKCRVKLSESFADMNGISHSIGEIANMLKKKRVCVVAWQISAAVIHLRGHHSGLGPVPLLIS